MIIFIDFDDVLFNSKKFRKDLSDIFFKFGVTHEIFQKYYCNPNQNKVIKTYDPWNHLKMIEQGENIFLEGIAEKIEKFMIDLTKYLFSDSMDFLQSFDRNCVYIVSYGESFFQKKKIDGSGLGRFCREVMITDNLKSDIIKKILKDNKSEKEPYFFIEDRAEQIEDVRINNPLVKNIFMRRPEGRYSHQLIKNFDFQVKNLREAKKTIQDQIKLEENR